GGRPGRKCASRSTRSITRGWLSAPPPDGREEWYHAGRRGYDRGVPDRSRMLLEFSAGGLVFDEQGRVLLIRARDLRGQPVWTLPKGALAPGESSADAALREVREETGYRCELEREHAPPAHWFGRR